jgi:putative ABC transport system substrate-binding protein
MIKKILVRLLATMLLTTAPAAEAQQANKIPRIGLLAAVSPAALAGRNEAFRRGLHDLGYVEGKNIFIESRYAEEKLERLPALATELRNLNVMVIVTAGAPATRAASKAANEIPIVMAQDNDPIGNGFVASLSRPGGNITGLSTLSAELNGKRLELLQEIVPKLGRVAILGNSTVPGNAQAIKEIKIAASALGIEILSFDIRHSSDIESAFRNAETARANAAIVPNNPIFSAQRSRVADLAVKSRLAAIYERLEYVEDGGLLSYGVSSADLFRRAATYADKILKGAKPADLPVEQPKKFEFIINLKAAKQIGLTIPPNVLARADRVIK